MGKDENQIDLPAATLNLDRMASAIGSNELSGASVTTDAGKTALSALLASASTGNFDAEEARRDIKSALRLG